MIAIAISASTITGSIVLASVGADNLINVESGSSLLIDGKISGTTGLLKIGPGSLEIKNAGIPNNYTGTTTVRDGTLRLNGGALDGAIPGPLIIQPSTIGGAIVQLLQSNQIANATPITITRGVLDLNGLTETVGGLILSEGTVTSNGGGLLRVNGNITSAAAATGSFIDGHLSLIGATRTFTVDNGSAAVDLEIVAIIEGSVGFIKNGAGLMHLGAINPYSGPTILNAGILEIDAIQQNSPVTVTGGTLGGHGVIGTLTGTGGFINPGSVNFSTTDNLETQSVVLGAATYSPDLIFNTLTGLPQSDRLVVTGSVDVTGATLAARLTNTPLIGNRFTIIENDGTDPVVGTFNGRPEGARFLVGGITFQITYRSGDGNEVVLTVVTPPFLPLAVSGRRDGSAVLFAPGTGGQFATTPAATLSPFGAIPANVRTAVADVNNDGTPDTILVTGPGTPIRFAVVSGVNNSTLLIPPTAPFAGSEDFTGGGFVSAADLDGDGRAEIVVTPDQGGGPRAAGHHLLARGNHSDGSRELPGHRRYEFPRRRSLRTRRHQPGRHAGHARGGRLWRRTARVAVRGIDSAHHANEVEKRLLRLPRGCGHASQRHLRRAGRHHRRRLCGPDLRRRAGWRAARLHPVRSVAHFEQSESVLAAGGELLRGGEFERSRRGARGRQERRWRCSSGPRCWQRGRFAGKRPRLPRVELHDQRRARHVPRHQRLRWCRTDGRRVCGLNGIIHSSYLARSTTVHGLHSRRCSRPMLPFPNLLETRV